MPALHHNPGLEYLSSLVPMVDACANANHGKRAGTSHITGHSPPPHIAQNFSKEKCCFCEIAGGREMVAGFRPKAQAPNGPSALCRRRLRIRNHEFARWCETPRPQWTAADLASPEVARPNASASATALVAERRRPIARIVTEIYANARIVIAAIISTIRPISNGLTHRHSGAEWRPALPARQ